MSANLYQHYSPRVLLLKADVDLLPGTSGALVALSWKSLYIVRNLMQYAYRRANWVGEMLPTGDYYSIDDDDPIWNVVTETDWRLSDVLRLEDLTNAIQALQCVCTGLYQLIDTVATAGQQSVVADGETVVVPPAESLPGPGHDQERCALATAFYQMFYELIIEVALPATGSAFVVIIPALASLIATMVSGPLALPVATATAMIGAWIGAAIEASAEDLQNWLLQNREEAICDIYFALEHGTAAGAAALDAYIQANMSQPITAIVLRAAACTWVCNCARAAQIEESDWYLAVASSADCSECEEEPPEGCQHHWDFASHPGDALGWTGDIELVEDGLRVVEFGWAYSPRFIHTNCETALGWRKWSATQISGRYYLAGEVVGEWDSMLQGWAYRDPAEVPMYDQIAVYGQAFPTTVLYYVESSCCPEPKWIEYPPD